MSEPASNQDKGYFPTPDRGGIFGFSGNPAHNPQLPAYGAPSIAHPRDQKAAGEFWYLGTQIPDPNHPRVGLNTIKYPPYEPAADWDKLEAMVEPIPLKYGTAYVADPVQVARVLLTLNTFQRDALNDYATIAAGKTVVEWMDEAPADTGYRATHAVETLRGIATGPLAHDVWLANWTLKGKFEGPDAFTMVEIICDRDQNDLRLLMAQYKKTYNVELDEAIRKKFSGNLLGRLLLSALTLERPSDAVPVQSVQVAKDVDALWNATRDKAQDSVITDIFTNRSRPHLAATITQYALQHGQGLRRDIKKHFKGKDYGNAILYIIDGTKSKGYGYGAWRDAKLLMATMKGIGTRSVELKYRVVRAHWNLPRFVAVKKAFKERYGISLEDRIADDTSGEFKSVLHMICHLTRDIEG